MKEIMSTTLKKFKGKWASARTRRKQRAAAAALRREYCVTRKSRSLNRKKQRGLSDSITDRQERIPGFDQLQLTEATVAVVGVGGIGTEVMEGLSLKGVGHIKAFDRDKVSKTNLNRQHFFRRDIGHNKAHRAVINFARLGSCGTRYEGWDLHFQEAVDLGVDMTADVAVVGVDHRKSRLYIARYYLKQGIPVIFLTVDMSGECCRVYVQEPGKACYACAFPRELEGDATMPCRVPSVKDPLKVAAGLALYAVDSLLMARNRGWNLQYIHLAGFAPHVVEQVEAAERCPLCAEAQFHKERSNGSE